MLRSGSLEIEVSEHIRAAVQTCKHVFSGMPCCAGLLHISRSGHGHVQSVCTVGFELFVWNAIGALVLG